MLRDAAPDAGVVLFEVSHAVTATAQKAKKDRERRRTASSVNGEGRKLGLT